MIEGKPHYEPCSGCRRCMGEAREREDRLRAERDEAREQNEYYAARIVREASLSHLFHMLRDSEKALAETQAFSDELHAKAEFWREEQEKSEDTKARLRAALREYLDAEDRYMDSPAPASIEALAEARKKARAALADEGEQPKPKGFTREDLVRDQIIRADEGERDG